MSFAYYSIVVLIGLLLLFLGARSWLVLVVSGPLGLLVLYLLMLLRQRPRVEGAAPPSSLAGQMTDLAMSYLAVVTCVGISLALVSLELPLWAAIVVGTPVGWCVFMCVVWVIGKLVSLPLSE
jgi:hypothetical protein